MRRKKSGSRYDGHHKIKKALYKATHGAEYNDALRNRADITIGFTQDAVNNGRPAKTGGYGRSHCDPSFSCISKRTVKLPVLLLTKAMKPGSVVIFNSTGLKVYGTDEWHPEKMRFLRVEPGEYCAGRSMNIRLSSSVSPLTFLTDDGVFRTRNCLHSAVSSRP